MLPLRNNCQFYNSVLFPQTERRTAANVRTNPLFYSLYCRLPRASTCMRAAFACHRLTGRLRGALMSCAMASLLLGCAVLPDVRYLNSTLTPAEEITVEGVNGALSPRRAQSLVAKQLRSTRLNLQDLATLEEAATGRPLISGNKVTLLFDGPQTMAAMLEAIETAKDHINLETYIFDQDELGLLFADALIAKQRAGVQVNIIYDSVGTIGTPAEFFTRMRDAGINLVEFNPVNPLKRLDKWRINNRDHRKILVVDGRVAFTGGINITADYSESSLFRSKNRKRDDTEVGWRDTHIRVEGPAVAAIQFLFLDVWTRQTNRELQDRNYFPAPVKAGDKLLRVLGSEPGGDFEIYKAYILAIQEAKRSIHISSPYFAPDAQVVRALTEAAQRGVDVKIIFPSITDSGLIFHAGRSYYKTLLKSGIQIFELQVAVLHAKTAVIDGVWSTVGSANLDMRSFLHNNEINVVVLGEEFGRAMESAFNEDLRNSVEITLETWRRRPFIDRIKEWSARRFGYWL